MKYINKRRVSRDECYAMTNLRDKIVPTVAMMITIGAFAAEYDGSGSNNDLYKRRTDAPKKPTIEAVLNKEEESFILPKAKNPYGKKKNFYYRQGIESKMYV